ncbi:zinc finger CCCH domain-containing protein 24 [Medicago truncatula]|uniref:Zinc finger CCCH domain protein n=2 Tax=Medicago truncatula TaxID=3880 RepID=A0A072V568_MEDTR|nr:zinc finger CCCH domain-containing protein 24 [Medicago truncatula]KEH33325.1 zinc finger CCCH domain protein [Medicago truncatula]
MADSMVDASDGSIDTLKVTPSGPEAGVNASDADSSGLVNAADAAGADINRVDANGNHPVDVMVVPHKLEVVKTSLEELLLSPGADISCSVPLSVNSSSPHSAAPLSSAENESPSSPVAPKFTDTAVNSASEKKEYPIALPSVESSMYATDEFRMYSFKVLLCPRAYSHDWTECPFKHPHENARRRDLRKFTYSCVPCPDFKKGDCKRADTCEFAHGLFETWLHPDRYRTILCKDGTSCDRKVCFFAHLAEELRPIYVSTGSAVPLPRSAASAPNVMDNAAATSLYRGLLPTPFALPLSPYANGISPSNNARPALRLPGRNMFQDIHCQQHMLNDLSCFSQPRPGAISVSRSVNSWSNWGSRTRKPDWSVNGSDFGRSQHGNNDEDPDLSWVQSLLN